MSVSKSVEQLAEEMKNGPITHDQLTRLAEDKTPAGREAYLAATTLYIQHSSTYADKLMEALTREKDTSAPPTLEEMRVLFANKDTTRESFDAYCKAMRKFTEYHGCRASLVLFAIRGLEGSEEQVNTLIAQGKKLKEVEETLETTLRQVRKANEILRAATPWWKRIFGF